MPLKLENGLEGAPLSAEAPAQSATRTAQHAWAAVPLRTRLKLLRRARHQIATTAVTLAHAVPCERPGALHRSVADTLVAEVLPLVEACRFLEREASFILAPQKLSNHGRPFWLSRVTGETRREPVGLVLIIAPANYPLFLPGVQALQALAAGNAVLWKPAPGGKAAAEALRTILVSSGLDPALLQVLEESPKAATDAMTQGVDKVFLTGSATTGASVLNQLAPSLTPSVMELSGCDAMFVLPGAQRERVLQALQFGLRLNGSATCMAPRRLFLVGDQPGLVKALLERCHGLPAVSLPEHAREMLRALLEDAQRRGGEVHVEEERDALQALRFALVRHATPEMRIVETDVFAPVLSIFEVRDVPSAARIHAACPYALTAAIFGPESEAHKLALQLPVNTVLINDVIVSTADPRISFGGRKASGFGLTRGREGLLEMTTLKTVVTQNSRDLRAYRPTGEKHVPFFSAYLEAAHGDTLKVRWKGFCRLVRAAARLD